MKKLYAIALIGSMLFWGSTELKAQIQTPQPSPSGSVSSMVGLTTIKVDYSRPKVKGRQIFGEGSDFLVPYGQLWRTGANSGTVISFDDDIAFGDKMVKAGEYLIFSIPAADSWTVMLYGDVSLGGNVGGYDESKEVARVMAKATSGNPAVETLTVNISDISADNSTAAIEIAWADVSAKIPVKVDYDAKVMAAIERHTKVNPNNLAAAANYYYSTGRDLDQAIAWMQEYLKDRGNQFWNVHTLAQMMNANENYEAARETAQKSLDLATAAANDFGYIKLNNTLLEEITKNESTSKKKSKKKK